LPTPSITLFIFAEKKKKKQRNPYVDQRQWVTWMIGGLQLASEIVKEGGRMGGGDIFNVARSYA
jgi:hypothetical protein